MAELIYLDANTWRYENTGTADSLIVSGTTLTNLPASQSKTGTAFYQTTRAKCFDLPATAEVWMKFDVYFNGSHRWRAYNEGSNGSAGITAQTDGRLGFFVNGIDKGHFDNICIANQLQTVLLHMISGSSDGIVEAWVDGTKIYTYTGDVNHGQDFADIYLQSDGSGTFFSNVIISNAQIGLDENITCYDLVFKPEPEIYISWIPRGQVEIKPFLFASILPTTSTAVEFLFDVEVTVTETSTAVEFLFDVEVTIGLEVALATDVSYVTTYIMEFLPDIAVWYAFAIEFLWDVQRNIPLEINLNAIADTDPEPQVAPLHMLKAPLLRGEGETIRAIPDTPGLQSLELTIAAGQLSTRLKFTGVQDIPILGAATGKYLDYAYNMSVTRKSMSRHPRQSNTYSTYECWYDIAAMLYTQINYTVTETVFNVQVDSGSKTVYLAPTSTGYTPVGEETSEGSAKSRSTAKEHLKKIANVLGLKPDMQFQDFIVDLELEQVDVTPADLISKIFGWTARVPNKLISVFPAVKNGARCLCAIQRGWGDNSSGGFDISSYKQSVARIEQKLVRTLWGSSVKSSTYTVETHYGGLYVLLPPPAASPDGRTTYTYSEVNGGYLLATSTTQNDDGSVTTVNYEYSEVDGVYTCALEDAITRDEEGEIISRTYTSHHILTPSQQLSRMFDEDGNLIATAVSSHLPGLYERKQTLLAPRVEVEERALPAIPLLDTSFPIIDSALVENGGGGLLTFAELAGYIKKLNLATQEAVTLDIYDCPHVLNLNDPIIVWSGGQYFLVSNTTTANQQIANKQSITLVRWIPYGGNGN